jgi:hypothetical protein
MTDAEALRFTNRLTWREIVALYHFVGSGNSERNRQSGGSLDKLLLPAHCLRMLVKTVQ